ncbi:Transcription factor DUO1 [Linum grandiflorum]
MEVKKDEVRKGPWKAEEDEVLLNHVHKYGPREWSSIRSKGLLQRTGKSCRLRWVNKLRPNLKNGCKFSEDEQRIVIELQARLGNKWAKIATYLAGRTDNDVKNFWSSRQKRLARLNSSALPSASNSSNTKKESPNLPLLQAPPMMSSSSMEMEEEEEEEEEESSTKKVQLCSSNTDPIKMVPFSGLIAKPELVTVEPEAGDVMNPPFPPPQPPELISFSPESQELLARLEDPFFFNVFGAADIPQLGDIPELSLGPPLSDHPLPTGGIDDDFPPDLFDHIDRLPSPSHW